jgi:putative PIN family toxin of toxin-antitoxin system
VRAVVDTNVLVSGAMKERSAPHTILGAAADGVFELVTSRQLLDELRRVLARPRIARRIDPSHGNQNDFLAYMESVAVRTEPAVVITEASRDPDDNRVLEAAIAGRVEYIVTGDDDLLALGNFRDIPIVNAAVFIAILEAERSG